VNDALEHRAALHLLSLLERERSHNLVAVGPA